MSQRPTVSVGARYRLLQFLGQGGMGSVYRAYDRLTEQHVALKLVSATEDAERPAGGEQEPLYAAKTAALTLESLAEAHKRAGPSDSSRSAILQTVVEPLQATKRGRTSTLYGDATSPQNSMNPIWARMALAQEFRTLASLRHPHIISVLDYGFVARSQPFFTMEFLENARSLTAVSKNLPLPEIALLMLQLLRALSYLHRHGILHRDLKPANVMVQGGAEGLQVKLLDFGLALVRSHSQANPEELAGTLSYMAPELFEGRPASEAADLFAVGVIAYELFTRRHPFERGDEGQIIESILKCELDWEPLKQHPALLSLLRRLLARSDAARPSADEALQALSAAVGIPIPQETAALRESTLQAARFVGREEPLEKLSAAMEAVRTGRGEVWLLAGESGVGKSRLMEELRVYSLVRGLISARGQAVSEGGGAYCVWREILRMLCLCTELDELEASVLKSIVTDLEVLLERAIPDAPAINPQAAHLRLINAVESLILRQAQPLLLLLEDLHWADAESRALLQRLASSCRSHPILIVGSFRDDERPELPQEFPGCPVLKLNRLSASNIAALCRSMLGEAGCTPELVNFLEAETEGNVFFAIEVMRALAEEAGQLSLVASHRLPKSILTGGIQAIVQRRLSRLHEEALPLLRLAAVAGRQLDLAVLRCFEPNIEPWLYLSADAAVLEVSGQSWHFAHDKIRESLLLGLAPTERQRLHFQIARALERTYPGSAPHAAALAEHYHRGGSRAQAAFYLVEAGVYSLSQGATAQATALLEQALEPESRPLLSRVQAARAYNALVQAALARGRIVSCIATYEQFAKEAGLPSPKSFLSIARLGGAMLARWLRIGPAMTRKTEEERRILIDVAQATRWASEAYVWQGQPLASIFLALRGAELAHALGDKALQSYFLAGFAYFAGLIPLHEVSLILLKKGGQLLDGLGNPRAELDFRRIASTRHLNAADWELAKSELDALIALSRRLGDENYLMLGLGQYLHLAFRQSDEKTFASIGPEMYERSRRNQTDQFSRVYPYCMAIAALRCGDVESAQRWIAEAESYIGKSQDVLGRVITDGLTAQCLLYQGKKEEALTCADKTLALIESNRLSVLPAGEGIAGVAEVYLSLWEAGNVAERRHLSSRLRRALSALRRFARSIAAYAPRSLLLDGKDAWNQGAVRRARRLAQASQRQARSLGMPFDEALAAKWLERFNETPPDSCDQSAR